MIPIPTNHIIYHWSKDKRCFKPAINLPYVERPRPHWPCDQRPARCKVAVGHGREATVAGRSRLSTGARAWSTIRLAEIIWKKALIEREMGLTLFVICVVFLWKKINIYISDIKINICYSIIQVTCICTTQKFFFFFFKSWFHLILLLMLNESICNMLYLLSTNIVNMNILPRYMYIDFVIPEWRLENRWAKDCWWWLLLPSG